MKVCDVVLDSVWYDPRVRKQLIEYLNNGIEVEAVGLKCRRYDEKKIAELPCNVKIVAVDDKLNGKGLIKSIRRKLQTKKRIMNAILESKPDVIHANDFNALVPACSAAKKLKCAILYDSHEINSDNYSTRKKFFYAFLIKKMEKRLVKRIDHMICVSNAAAEYFAKEYGIEKPTVVTNCSLKSDADVNMRKKNDFFEVLNHGLFYGGRGYDIMAKSCDLFSEHPEIKLAIRGYGQMENELHSIVEKAKNSQCFTFYPPVDTKDLISAATSSSVGVAITEPISLNFKLSVSNKIFEYTAAGLPVIMSDIPEHRYLNEKYDIGVILEENTPEAFSNAVMKLYSDKDFYESCVANAHKMFSELNWENEFKKVIRIIKTIRSGN